MGRELAPVAGAFVGECASVTLRGNPEGPRKILQLRYGGLHGKMVYRSLLLSALVDALEEVEVSVGQTTNLSLGSSRREADKSTATPDAATLNTSTQAVPVDVHQVATREFSSSVPRLRRRDMRPRQ